MNASLKIAGFIVGLAVVFATAAGVGAIVGRDGNVTAEHSQAHDSPPVDAIGADAPPGGLMSSQDGYTLELAESRIDAGTNVPLSFRIVDSTGAPVTRYVDNHEKQLHLIVARRDMAGYQHVHPILDADGTWRAPVDLSRAGDYRVFADFIPAAGRALTLGADVHVAGPYDPRPLPAAETTATVDGYTVALRGSPKANEPSTLTLSVSRAGKPVTDLQPYLGAYGHLVALRASDLAYLHVHPTGEPHDGTTPAGPEIGFQTSVPSAGDYRLFLDFRHQGVMRTAEFTMSVGAGASPAQTVPAVAQAEPVPGSHGH